MATPDREGSAAPGQARQGSAGSSDVAAGVPAGGGDLDVRRWLLAILSLGIVGTLAELLLIGHTEETWQLTPLVLLGLATVAIAAHVVKPSSGSLRALRGVMLLFVLAGILGVYLHFDGNLEFELEMYPTMGGTDLVWEALTGATPTLAPGNLALIGLVGLAYTYRHPLLTGPEG